MSHGRTRSISVLRELNQIATFPDLDMDSSPRRASFDQLQPKSRNTIITLSEPSTPVQDALVFDLDGFTDFNLDLSLLSTPDASNSLTLTPVDSSPPSGSASTAVTSPPSPESPSKQRRSHELSATSHNGVLSILQSSLPLVRYVGRGTPIDRSRRLEWGGLLGENEVGEDGMLFAGASSSQIHSASLDSGLNRAEGVLHRRTSSSASSWDLLPPLASPFLSPRSHTRSPSMSDETGETAKAPTEHIHVSGLSDDPDAEWASVMDQVLGSSSSPQHASTSRLEDPQTLEEPEEGNVQTTADGLHTASSAEMLGLLPTQSELAHGNIVHDIDIDMGIDAALDLGLGVNLNNTGGPGMTWSSLGLLPSSGRGSPSVYSTSPATPSGSRSSMHDYTTADEDGFTNGPDSTGGIGPAKRPWWRKTLTRVRQSWRRRRVEVWRFAK